MKTLRDLSLSNETREMTESLVIKGFINEIILANKTCQILLNKFESINTETAYILNNLMTELKNKNITYLLKTAA